MPVEYRPAPEAAKIGRQLINKHHTHLAGERVDFVFRSEAAKAAGKTIWGKARKVTGLNAYLATATGPDGDGLPDADSAEPFFVIELALDVWNTLDGKQRVALVDHELSHCQIGTNGLTCAPHDLEEFESVVRRHGFYRTDVKHMAKVMVDVASGDQMSLLDDE